MMTEKGSRAAYTLEFKLEAVRLVQGGEAKAVTAKIFVVSHEVIPETHRNGHQTAATIGLMGGFAVMMVLDTALG